MCWVLYCPEYLQEMYFALAVVLLTTEINLRVVFLTLHGELDQCQSGYGCSPCDPVRHSANSKLWLLAGVDYHIVTAQEEVMILLAPNARV